VNQHLVAVYDAVRDDPEGLKAELKAMQEEYERAPEVRWSKESEPDLLDKEACIAKGKPYYYYHVRARFNASPRASRFVFLNRAGFRGLYREAKGGRFNVPFGNYKNPLLCPEEDIDELHELMTEHDVRVRCESFEESLACVNQGDFVYADPPYVDTFTDYVGGGFGPKEQASLCDMLEHVTCMGGSWVASNSDREETRRLYDQVSCRYETIPSKSRINSKTPGSVVDELLILGGM